ncbi:MAG TPA: hypothetical protein VJ201_03285, partial [Candidatus Babeliales bacterium]|nr:hypothetical protein [Candidatus Babeliales bacterium]
DGCQLQCGDNQYESKQYLLRHYDFVNCGHIDFLLFIYNYRIVDKKARLQKLFEKYQNSPFAD